jgi:hypothetical protein
VLESAGPPVHAAARRRIVVDAKEKKACFSIVRG